jgi:hypothetical protein
LRTNSRPLDAAFNITAFIYPLPAGFIAVAGQHGSAISFFIDNARAALNAGKVLAPIA